MKKLLLLSIGCLTTFVVGAQSFDDLKWLEGKWERQNARPGMTAFEVWEKTDQGFKGMGVSLKGADTVFVENLKIVQKDGALHYVAEVSSNQAPTYFKITSATENGFVSENPQHDFPKKIAYTLEGKKLTAVISAGEKAMGFVFERSEN